ncbi:MAG: ABC transporter substrate-binding protein [Bacteroidota bacterium]
MKRPNAYLALALFFFLLSSAACSPNKGASKAEQQLRVGAILPLTGDLAFLGNPERAALVVAAEEINEAEDRDLELFIEDSRGQARDAVAAARKLIDVHGVNLGIVSTSALSNAVAPAFQEADIPLITICSDGTVPERYNTAINFYANLENEQEVMANYLEDQGIFSISTIRLNAQVTELGIELLQEFSGGTLSIVNDLAYSLANPDFRSLVARVKNDSSDAVYLMGYGVEFPALVRALRELEVEKPIFGNYTFLSDAARVDEAGLYDGIHFTAFTITPEDIAATDFGRAFAAEMGNAPGPFMDYVFVYEAMKTWNRALEAGVEPSQFAEHARGLTFDTLFGTVTIDSTGNAVVPMAVGTYTDGGSVQLVVGTSEPAPTEL